MNELLEKRVIELGEYISDTSSTIRKTAKIYGVSKSTVHTDVTIRLKSIDPELYSKVRIILDNNKAQRHIRGGIATKNKYILKNFDLQKNKNDI